MDCQTPSSVRCSSAGVNTTWNSHSTTSPALLSPTSINQPRPPITYQYPVRVHDCVEAMSNGHNSALGEVVSDGSLDDLVSPMAAVACHMTT